MDRTNPPAGPTREARLAAQLRANLRRRKQQARALEQKQPAQAAPQPSDEPGGNPAPANPTLVKPVGDG
jgi:hypothetical protein